MARIDLKGVSHTYDGSTAVLQNVSLSWPSGGAYALLGPSGCGKTTLLKIISGLLRPTAGIVEFDGGNVTEKDPLTRNIAQVFQFPIVYESMTVWENLAFPLRNRRMDATKIATRVGMVAELLRLSGELKMRAAALPPALQQLVSLGRGLVREDTAAVLLDEPLTVIDPHERWRLRRVLRDIQAELAISMVLVTHDQLEAMTFAERVVVMNEGIVLQEGTPDDLFARPDHAFVGHFVGSPGMNFLSAGSALARELLGGQRVPESVETIGIRPEFLRVVPVAEGLSAAEVERAVELEAGQIVSIAADGARLFARHRVSRPLAPRQPVRLEADPESVIGFDDSGRRVPTALPVGGNP